jgi:signal peptide peptidase SppA
MKLFSIEPSAFTARESLRGRANLTINAEAMRKPAPMMQANRSADGVAVIDIRGVMLASPDALDEFFGGFTNTRAVTRAVQLASADSGIGAIVLRIDSPGGSVEGLAELGDAVSQARHRKPVIAVVEGLCASAAFYAAAGATAIYAGRMDLVGSIGTIVTVYDMSKSFGDAGIRTVVIDTGKFKGTGTLGTELSADEQTYLQSIVDAYFSDFRRMVMSGRGTRLSLADWSAVSDGRIFLASEAKRLGLVDRFATMGDTLARLHGESLRTQVHAQRSRLRILDMKAPRRRMSERERGQRAALQMLELTGCVL